MRETFSTPAEVNEAFVALVSAGAVAIGIMSAVVLVLLWDDRRKWHVKSVSAFAVLGFIAMIATAYSSTFDHFITAEVKDSGLELQYVGPFGEIVVLQRDAIESVLSGTPGKALRPCYLKVVLKSMQTYRSAELDTDLDSCKRMRSRIVNALAP